MNTSAVPHDQHLLLAKEFFLARQPILDREQSLVAYELLFRSAASGAVNVTDDLTATAAVIAHASELGMEQVIGDMLGFVNVDAAVLMSDFVRFLPTKKVVLEILETVKATPELVARVAELAQAGFRFALDDVIAESDDVRQFLPYVELIKVDIKGMAPQDLTALSLVLSKSGKKLLAEKVETLEDFKLCLELGFEFFQGYYFARPVILTGKKIAPSELALMELMSLIESDAEDVDIERTIKQDASLSLNLLRLVNTPAVGARTRIDTLGQALGVLGRRQLKRWLQIMLYAKPGTDRQFTSPLLQLATTRGKLLELMAEKLGPGQRNVADIAFTVGVMSLMDTLFGVPMTEVLSQVPVNDDVRSALLLRRGVYGEMLKLAEYIENIEQARPLLMPTLGRLQLTTADLYDLQLAAFEWSNKVASAS
jgi:EAL and modified HD-GYP domain-containing signal transduction protein